MSEVMAISRRQLSRLCERGLKENAAKRISVCLLPLFKQLLRSEILFLLCANLWTLHYLGILYDI